MKKLISIVLGLLLILSCFVACVDQNKYIPSGEFYVKTSPSVGDGGVSDVISLEAERATYEGDGDVTVPMTVGFGHLPNPNHKLGCGDSFYVHYKVIKMSPQAGGDDVTVWEKKVEYPDCWHTAKYESTEQKNYPFLFIPHYGEFYPLYKENVEIVFPADVERGIVEIEINAVKESDTSPFIHKLSFYFFRTDGVLTLNH